MAALPNAARGLLDAAVNTNPFVSAPWLERFEQHLVTPAYHPVYFVCEIEHKPVLVVPMVSSRLLGLPGRHLESMSNFYTGLYTPVIANELLLQPRHLNAVIAAFADHVALKRPKLGLLDFAPLRLEQSPNHLLPPAFSGAGFSFRRYVKHGNWYEPIAGRSFDEYLSDRPGFLVNTLRRKQRKLARETEHEYEIIEDPGRLAEKLPDYNQIYARSWKTDEYSVAFINEVMCALAEYGIVRLGLLSIDGRAAAAQIWVKIGNAWGVFKLAYDPAYKAYSAGTLLMAKMIESLIDRDGAECLDFLSGDDDYKADWASQRREHFGFELIRKNSMLGRLIHLRRRVSGLAVDDNAGST